MQITRQIADDIKIVSTLVYNILMWQTSFLNLLLSYFLPNANYANPKIESPSPLRHAFHNIDNVVLSTYLPDRLHPIDVRCLMIHIASMIQNILD